MSVQVLCYWCGNLGSEYLLSYNFPCPLLDWRKRVVPQRQLFVVAAEHDLFDRFYFSMLRPIQTWCVVGLNGDMAGNTLKNGNDHLE